MHTHDNVLDVIILLTMIVSMYFASFILHETKKNERFLIQNTSVTPTTSVHGAVLVIVLSLSFYE